MHVCVCVCIRSRVAVTSRCFLFHILPLGPINSPFYHRGRLFPCNGLPCYSTLVNRPSITLIIIRLHCMPRVHRCRLLLPMFCVSVCVSISQLDMSCTDTAELIVWMWTWKGSQNRALDGGLELQGKGQFLGASPVMQPFVRNFDRLLSLTCRCT